MMLTLDDTPYTTPEEDPFNIRPLLAQPRRRRSSMLNKWIQEQQIHPSESHDVLEPRDSPSKHLNPYLAYPDLGQVTSQYHGSAVTINSYDLVDDEDIPKDLIPEIPIVPPSTPTTPSQKSKFFGTPTSFRSLHIPFRPSTPRQLGSTTETLSSTPSRMSFLPLGSRFGPGSGRNTPKQHTRSASASAIHNSSASTVDSPPSGKWRPSVLDYFTSSATSQVSVLPSETHSSPSRPSMSSSTTATTSTFATVTDGDHLATPIKASYGGGSASLRLRSPSHGSVLRASNAVPSLLEKDDEGSCAASTSKSNSLRVPLALKSVSRLAGLNIDVDEVPDEDEQDCDSEVAQTRVVVHESTRPEVAFSSGKGGPPRVSFSALSAKNQKKKKLVISGIAPNDRRKFEGAKRWCESFGEVTHIMRMPNGDLHVHFRSADVADTVCRLRAKVFIAGVGSVNLSWYTGNKR